MLTAQRRRDPNGFKQWIHTPETYQRVLDRIAELSDAPSSTDDGEELEFLVNQVQKYEREH